MTKVLSSLHPFRFQYFESYDPTKNISLASYSLCLLLVAILDSTTSTNEYAGCSFLLTISSHHWHINSMRSSMYGYSPSNLFISTRWMLSKYSLTNEQNSLGSFYLNAGTSGSIGSNGCRLENFYQSLTVHLGKS